MKFTKMQGCGNDYVYINCFEETVTDPANLAIAVSDRHFGIGSDGLILIRPSLEADCEMDMYNADGSRGAMCGNGIRCVAKYVYDNGIVRKTQLTVATGSGIKTLDLQVEDGKVSQVRVDMGEVRAAGNVPLTVDGHEFYFTAVSVGNPHAVVFLESKRTAGEALDAVPIETIGPVFEKNAAAPERVNTEFIETADEHTLLMRVWERGSGETLACGTGACAAAVAGILTGRVQDGPVTVKLRGGDLLVEWNRETGHVFMTGSAVTVFTGEF